MQPRCSQDAAASQEATGPIKGYSPELMVSEVYRHSHMLDDSTYEAEQRRMVDKVRPLAAPVHSAHSRPPTHGPHSRPAFTHRHSHRHSQVSAVLPRLHALAIGPGLGRDERAALHDGKGTMVTAIGIWLGFDGNFTHYHVYGQISPWAISN